MNACHIVLMGPPGAGKSTCAQELADALHLKVIDTGDLLRDEVSSGSTLGQQADAYMKRGDLVPADLVANVLDRRLSQPDVQQGFVLDGYPRTMTDVNHLLDWARLANVHDMAVVGLQVSAAEILKRVAGRRICQDGHDVNVDLNPPRVPDHCDIDGTLLARRPDDDPAVVQHRLDVYQQQTLPVVNALKQAGLYQEVDGTGTRQQVLQRLLQTLGKTTQAASQQPSTVS